MSQNSKKIRMLLNNATNEAILTLTKGSELTFLGLDNLKKYSNSHIFRTETTDEIIIEGTFNGLQSLSGLVMHRHNLSATAKWHVEIFSGDKQNGELLLDTGLTDVFETKLLGELEFGIDDLVEAINDEWEVRYKPLWFEKILAWSFRITIQDPDNTKGYIDIARLYIGQLFEPDMNFSFGSVNQVDANEKLIRTKGASLHTVKDGKQFRRFSFKFEYLTIDDRDSFYDAIYQGTKTNDWFISLYPDSGGKYEHHHAMACKFTTLPPFKHDYQNNWQAPFVIEEC
jgi:hypothetical protein